MITLFHNNTIDIKSQLSRQDCIKKALTKSVKASTLKFYW